MSFLRPGVIKQHETPNSISYAMKLQKSPSAKWAVHNVDDLVGLKSLIFSNDHTNKET